MCVGGGCGGGGLLPPTTADDCNGTMDPNGHRQCSRRHQLSDRPCVPANLPPPGPPPPPPPPPPPTTLFPTPHHHRYLESCAILPQLYMFQRQSTGVVEVLVSHSVFALGFARVVEMAFWMSSFHELTSHQGSKFVGYVVLIAQFAHVALMGDFFYFYFVSLQKGTPLHIPTQAGIV